MASEITAVIGLSLNHGNLRYRFDTVSLQVTQTGLHKSGNTQDIGTTEEALSIGGDLGTAGWAVFTNTDSTNFCTVGVKPSGTYYPVLKLKPGESFVVRLATSSLYAKADTAAVKLDYVILED